MRRLVVLPVKTSAVTAILLAGAVYVAAEARQAVVRHQELELARLETSFNRPAPTQDPALGRSANRVSENDDQPHILASTSGMSSLATGDAKTDATQQPDPGKSSKSSVDEHVREIVISVSDRRLALLQGGMLVKTYPIAVGTPWTPSPEGEFTIINHAVDPVYRHKGKEIQPGKNNPLGDRWMGLSLKGYGIHGTNVPASIGKGVSHGCFRMGRHDVEDLYSRVRVGDRVVIRRNRDEVIAKIFAPHATPAAGGTGTDDQTASAASTESTSAAVTLVQQ